MATNIKTLSSSVGGGYQKYSDEIIPNSPDGLNVEIVNFHKWAYKFASIKYGQTIQEKDQEEIIARVKHSLKSNESNILDKSESFFREEISWIKGKHISSKKDYLQAQRTGRGTPDR